MGIYIPDPSARVSPDGRLYVYGSKDESPEYYCSKSYDVLSTANTRKWKHESQCFTWNDVLYAPDAAFKDRKTYLYFCVPNGDEYVAVGDNPSGPFKDAVKIEGPRQIDPAIFVDDDGQAYYFYGQLSAKAAKLNPDMKTLDPNSFVDGIIDEEHHAFHEGSFVFKRGKWYYYVYADISRNHRPTCIGYSMATSPLGPYSYKGVIVDNAGCDPEVWNNHGSVVKFKGKWYVLYHRATHGSKTMRKSCIEEIKFNHDGTIDEVEMTTQGTGKPLNALKTIDAARACKLGGHVRVEEKGDSHGREVLSQIHKGDNAVWKYIRFRKKANLANIRINAPSGATVTLYSDDMAGRPIATISIPAAEGWQEASGKLEKTRGVHALWAVFDTDVEDDSFLMDWIRFSR